MTSYIARDHARATRVNLVVQAPNKAVLVTRVRVHDKLPLLQHNSSTNGRARHFGRANERGGKLRVGVSRGVLGNGWWDVLCLTM